MAVVREPVRPTAPEGTPAPPGPATPAPLLLRVPVDPEAPARGAAELLAATLAVAADGTIQLEVVPTGARDGVGRLADRCQELGGLGVPRVGWRQLGSGRVADAIVGGGRAPGTFLCMALGSRHAPGSMLMSSVTEEVLRRSPVPVLVAGPRLAAPTGAFASVVVAAEGSEVATRAVAVATELAARLAMPLRTVRVESPDPAGAILRAVDHDAPVLVVGAHKRGGPRRFALGSVALDLVRRAPCPVLVVPANHPAPTA